jgi:hypothetical protein
VDGEGRPPLARKMQEHNVSIFALENLQKTWLASRRQIILYEGMVAGMAAVPHRSAGWLQPKWR